MKILTCDTSTLMASVCISEEDKVLAFNKIERMGSHSDVLNILIDDSLKQAHLKLNDIDVFVTGIGPGSFTGIRISLNTMKTLAYAHNKPCAGVNSLAALAQQVKNPTSSVVVMINAFKNMVYFAEYEVTKDINVIEKIAPFAVRVQELAQFVPKSSLVIGDGYLAYKDYLINHLKLDIVRDSSFSDYPTARESLNAFLKNKETKHWYELLPLYIRESEADENKRGFTYQPL